MKGPTMMRPACMPPVKMVRFGPAKRTRYADLGYQCREDHWRVLDLSRREPGDEPRGVGPCYASEAELLADLDRFAHDFGCNPGYVADDCPTLRLKRAIDGMIATERMISHPVGSVADAVSRAKVLAYHTVLAQVLTIVTGSTAGEWPESYKRIS